METHTRPSLIRLLPAFDVRKPSAKLRKRKYRPKSVLRTAPRSLTPLDNVQLISKELDQVTAAVDQLSRRLQLATPMQPVKEKEEVTFETLYRRSFNGPLIAANLYSRSIEKVPWLRHRRKDSQTIVLSM